jgi:probable HAF family extracellular repeat protein
MPLRIACVLAAAAALASAGCGGNDPGGSRDASGSGGDAAARDGTAAAGGMAGADAAAGAGGMAGADATAGAGGMAGAGGSAGDAGAPADTAGGDAGDGGVDQAAAVTCPTVPALTDVPLPFDLSGATGSVSVGDSRVLASGSGGSGLTSFSFFFYNPDTNPPSFTPIYGPSSGTVEIDVSSLAAQTPDGNGAVGIDSRGHAIACSGNCIELGTIGVDGNRQSSATDTNNAGVVVGVGVVSITSPTIVSHPFMATFQTGMVDLGTLGGTNGSASAVNTTGKIVGSADTASGGSHAFLWDGTMHDLGTLGGATSAAGSINDAGQVAGASTTPSGESHAFFWDGTMHDLGTLGGTTSNPVAINSSGQIAGTSTTASGDTHAFLWDGTMHDLGTLGGTSSTVSGHRALNDAGQIVGASTNAAGQSRAFVWQLSVMRDLGTLGGATATGVGINSSGRAAGTSVTASGVQHGFTVVPGACTAAGP